MYVGFSLKPPCPRKGRRQGFGLTTQQNTLSGDCLWGSVYYKHTLVESGRGKRRNSPAICSIRSSKPTKVHSKTFLLLTQAKLTWWSRVSCHLRSHEFHAQADVNISQTLRNVRIFPQSSCLHPMAELHPAYCMIWTCMIYPVPTPKRPHVTTWFPVTRAMFHEMVGGVGRVILQLNSLFEPRNCDKYCVSNNSSREKKRQIPEETSISKQKKLCYIHRRKYNSIAIIISQTRL